MLSAGDAMNQAIFKRTVYLNSYNKTHGEDRRGAIIIDTAEEAVMETIKTRDEER